MQKNSIALMKRNGTVNIERRHLPKSILWDFYHQLLIMRWSYLFLMLLVGYLVANAIFAFLYCLQPNSIEGARSQNYIDAFFFSVQTMSTVGYGHLAPATIYANILVTIETTFGLMGFAVIGGLAFSKFSRPTARVLFSDKALITDYQGKRTFMFRVANARLNQIVDAQMNVTFLKSETTQEGTHMRKMIELPLIRSYTPIFAMTWLVMHTIDEESPLKDYAEDCDSPLNIIVTLFGTDTTLYQTIHSTHYYSEKDVACEGQFVDILGQTENGRPSVDFSKFHKIRRT